MLILALLSQPVSALALVAPDNSDYTSEILTAEFAANNNRPAEALQIYQKIALETKNPEIAKRATELSIELGNDEQALRTALIWADKDLQSVKAQTIAALLVVQYNSITNAEKYIKQLFTLVNPDSFLNIELVLNHPLDQQKNQELGTLLEKIKSNKELGNNAAVDLALSIYYEKNNNSQKSLEYANLAVKLDPQWSQAHMQKTKLLSAYNSAQNAINYLESTIVKYPKQVELRKLYADILYDMDQLDKAAKHYSILSQSPLYKNEALLQLAHISITQNNLKNAEKYLLELNQNPDYEELAKYYLGLINQQSGNYEKALECFAQLQNTENTEYVIKAKVRTAAILQSQK
ncbi:MAG: hypothetical protein KBD64_01240, partial [Gammaproteobacteria bacterium]|nr:hypothetical protein [Gammaproteobacteria bacterium]